MKRLLERGWAVFVIYLLLTVLWLWPVAEQLGSVAYQPRAQYSDLLVAHVPIAIFLRQALRTWTSFPLWNPTILSGMPLVADPLSGVWYLPNWMALIVPPVLAFNLLFFLHLAWAGLGVWRLLREEGVSAPAAFLGGLVFSGAPKLVGHVGLGHIGLVCAVSWTPWVLVAVRRMVGAAVRGSKPVLREAALMGGALGLVFLADARWILPAGLIALAYGVRKTWHSHKQNLLDWRKLLKGTAVGGGLSFGLAAGLWIPLWELVRLSTRVAMEPGEREALGLPAGRLLGLLIPQVAEYGEWIVYAGLSAVFLAVVGLAWRSSGSLFWLGLGLAGLLLALGSQTPVYGVLGNLPGMSLLRVPARMVFVWGMCVAMMVGLGVERLMEASQALRPPKAVRIAIVGLTAFVVILAAVVTLGGEGWRAGWWPFAAAAGLGIASAALVWVALRPSVPRWLVLIGWGLLIVVDLAWVDRSLVEVRSEQPEAGSQEIILQALVRGMGRQRVFSPSYSVPQHVAASLGLELASGVNPLQIATYRDFLAKATGFSDEAYSVTLPPFPSGDPQEDWSPEIDSEQLGLLSVGWLVSAYPIEADGLQAEGNLGGEYVLRNQNARPRAWVEELGASEGGTWEFVSSHNWSPNRIVIGAEGPGLLVVSEIWYPGWQVLIDGQESAIEKTHTLLRAVELQAGFHEVEFVYRPVSVYIGSALSLMAIAAGLWICLRR